MMKMKQHKFTTNVRNIRQDYRFIKNRRNTQTDLQNIA